MVRSQSGEDDWDALDEHQRESIRNSVLAVLDAVRMPIEGAVTYLIADAKDWEARAEDAPQREFFLHAGRLRRDIAARLKGLIDPK